MNKPLVTIIIACYNHQDYIEQSILSVLNQTFRDIELIVIDDYSTDNSVSVIQKLNNDKKFNFIRNNINKGLNNSIIAALNAAHGDYISVLASDDFIDSEKIEEQIKFLQDTASDGVYANGYTVQNNQQHVIKLNKIFNNYQQDEALKYLYQYDWGAPLLQSALFKIEVMKSLVNIRKEFKSDDWAFYIKVMENFKIGFINKPYFVYRLHDNNTHKKYWNTFPMRIDIAARLIPDKYKTKTFSNIFLTQSQYLFADKKPFRAIKFFICSLVLNFSSDKIIIFGRSLGSSLKKRLNK